MLLKQITSLALTIDGNQFDFEFALPVFETCKRSHKEFHHHRHPRGDDYQRTNYEQLEHRFGMTYTKQPEQLADFLIAVHSVVLLKRN